jgi:hypothetical protein
MNDSGSIVHTGQPHWLASPLQACPTCGSQRLVAVRDGNETNFVCEDCTRCWHVELGYVHRVDPHTCSRCRYAERCLAVYEADHR